MRSTLRRNAMTTPASVHCMSRQTHVQRSVSHWVQEEYLAPSAPLPRHHPHHLALDHVLLLELLDLVLLLELLDSLVLQVRTLLATPRFWISRQWHRINFDFSWFHADVVHVVFFVRNCTTSVLRISQLLLDPSINFLCNIRTFVEHVTFVTIQQSDSTLRRVFSNRQQWFAHRCLNTSNPEIGSPIVATHNLHSFACHL